MEADAEHQLLLGQMRNGECLHVLEQGERHARYLTRVERRSIGQATHNHVGVADCLDFVHIEVLDDRIEQSVQAI